MTEEQPDGDLIGARQKLSNAIASLIDPKRHTLPTGRHTWLDSTYHQLAESVYEKHALGGGRAQAASPLWIAAADCLHDVDYAVKREHPEKPEKSHARTVQPRLTHATVWRLHQIDARKWRPQDTKRILEFTTTLERHTLTAESLLNPAKRIPLPNPCPLCGLTDVYVDDSGDRVSQKALAVILDHLNPDADYCRCGNKECDGWWPRTKFLFLGQLLGNQPPEGVTA